MKESTLRNRLRRRGHHLVSKRDPYGIKYYAITNSDRLIVHGEMCGEFTLDLEDVAEWIKDYDAERNMK